jgi:hypothetical protein
MGSKDFDADRKTKITIHTLALVAEGGTDMGGNKDGAKKPKNDKKKAKGK